MLDSRLRLAAQFVRHGSRVADIGTDHAYLPIALVSEGVCPAAIASDVREGPVANARYHVEAAGLSEAISVRLGNGLHTVQPTEADDIVIAGMGGETVAMILEEAPWVRSPHYRLILQPMTRAEKLRAYLFENGFAVCEERVTQVGRHWYTVLCATYTGTVLSADEALCHVGRIPLPEGDGYLQVVENRLVKQQQSRPTPEGEHCLNQIRRYRSGAWRPWEE
ncbi:MAG: SAM-dependent methyltransferase [Clostridia bacterium]|nr:SAM-dependent methyltransferase [Clostridia bacterium]